MKEDKTTNKAELIIKCLYNKAELAQELGITRPTLDSRLSGKTDWKVLEVKWINQRYKGLEIIKNTEVK